MPRVACVGMERLPDRLRHVQSDQVEQLERTHWMGSAEFHALVDLGWREAGPLEQAHRVEQVGKEQPVHDESGLVRDLDGAFADRLADSDYPGSRRSARMGR